MTENNSLQKTSQDKFMNDPLNHSFQCFVAWNPNPLLMLSPSDKDPDGPIQKKIKAT